MDNLLQVLSEEWAIRALIASSMVGIMCGAIGSFIVLRNMSLIGDALAHAILPGVVVVFMLIGYSKTGFFFGCVAAGIITSIAITWFQHNAKTKNDAAIGIVFTAMFSLGVIGISSLNRRPGVHLDLKDFLFGSVLGVSNEDLVISFLVMLITLLSILIFYRFFFITTFQETIAQTMGISVKMVHYFMMLLLSFVIVSSLQSVGLILVVAMLITPSATALLLSNKLKNVVIISSLLGLLSAVLGFIIAVVFETTPGPAMCIVATIFYILAVFFSTKKGLVVRYLRRQEQRFKIVQEDIIKALYKGKLPSPNVATLAQALELPKNHIRKQLRRLEEYGILSNVQNNIELSIKGRQRAEELVRAHRLWETYLVDKTGLSEKQIHPEAERMEHLLTEDMLEEVDKKLGFPSTDPHGSPIPQKKEKPAFSMLQLRPRDRAAIAKDQINQWVESELWELGLSPMSRFRLISINKNVIRIKTNEGELEIPENLASQINITR